jgi:Ca2+-binding EF-hand superfamily protein
LEQAHEYLRERFTKRLAIEGWTLEEVFELVDGQGKNALSVYDIEKLIMEYRKCGSRSLMEDVELLFQMYDKSGSNKINFFDFKDQLTPLIN